MPKPIARGMATAADTKPPRTSLRACDSAFGFNRDFSDQTQIDIYWRFPWPSCKNRCDATDGLIGSARLHVAEISPAKTP
jgi:hypothetical protein